MGASYTSDVLGNVRVNELEFIDTVWDDLKAPLTAVRLAGVRDPVFEKFLDNGAASTGVYSYSFAAGVTREIFFIKQTRHGKKLGTDLKFHVHWSPSDNNAGTVRFGVEVTVAGINGTPANTTLNYFTDDCDGTDKKHQIGGTLDVPIPSETISSLIWLRFFRDGGDAADTYGSKIWVHEVDAHFEADQVGSREETAK